MEFLSPIFGYVLNFLYETINNYGIAIIIFSLLLRLILIPITIKQQKSMKKSAKMQEKMKEIQAKYKGNPEKLNQETMNLYKTEKMSPLTGCLSGILQIFIILSVFFVVSKPLTHMIKIDQNVIKNYEEKVKTENNGEIGNYPEIKIISSVEKEYQEVVKALDEKRNIIQENNIDTESVKTENSEEKVEEKIEENSENKSEDDKTENQEKSISEMTLEELENKKSELEKMRINMGFLGLDLSMVPSQNLGDWKVYIIPVLYVITSFVSIKITTSTQKKQQKKKNDVITEDGKPAETNEVEESMTQMSNTMLYMMPIMSISIAAIAPLGLALYWLVSNILMIIERLVINKFMKSEEEE